MGLHKHKQALGKLLALLLLTQQNEFRADLGWVKEDNMKHPFF